MITSRITSWNDLIETTTIKLMTEREEIDYVTCRFPACYAKSLQILRIIIDSMQLRTSQRHSFISRNLELVQFPVEVDMYEAPGATGLLPNWTSRLGESGQEYDLLMERDLKHLANWSDKDEDVWLEAMWESVVAHHHKKCVTKFDMFKNMCRHLDKFWDLHHVW